MICAAVLALALGIGAGIGIGTKRSKESRVSASNLKESNLLDAAYDVDCLEPRALKLKVPGTEEYAEALAAPAQRRAQTRRRLRRGTDSGMISGWRPSEVSMEMSASWVASKSSKKVRQA